MAKIDCIYCSNNCKYLNPKIYKNDNILKKLINIFFKKKCILVNGKNTKCNIYVKKM